MKKVLFVLLISGFTVLSLQAQVKEEMRAMIAGSQPALTILLEGVDVKFAETEWKDYTKTYGKVTKVKGSKESVIEAAHVGDVGEGNLLNVYSLCEEVPGGTQLVVWIDRGGSYISQATYPTEYATSETFLKNFAHKVKVDIVTMDLEDQQKKLEKFEANLAKLKRENESLHKTIADANAKIEQAEIDIPLNVKAQESAQTEITNQKSVVESVRDNPDELKTQQKQLSKLESNLTKLKKENDSLHKVITDSNSKIKQAELDIKANLEAQESATTEIETQKLVVSTVQKKLDGLKSQKTK